MGEERVMRVMCGSNLFARFALGGSGNMRPCPHTPGGTGVPACHLSVPARQLGARSRSAAARFVTIVAAFGIFATARPASCWNGSTQTNLINGTWAASGSGWTGWGSSHTTTAYTSGTSATFAATAGGADGGIYYA